MSQTFDLIEIILKQKLQIQLTDSEVRWLDNVDMDIKNTASQLIDSKSYLEEIVKMLDYLMEKANNLPQSEQVDIKNKCMAKKKELEYIMYLQNKNNNVVI